MLTLKAPLALICNPSVISSQESFYHRIIGNYSVISSGIDREDLLHMVTAPPEIYLEENGMTNLVQNTQIQNRQEQKLLMINNLLNRIAIMEEAHLTYQDRIYISSMLQKLGIEDVKQFMSQVYQSKQKIETTEQLVSLYWNHLEELKEMVEVYHSHEKTYQTKTKQVERERFYLHEEILRRLQTGAIYQILNNFYTSQNRHSALVTKQELKIAEQKQMAVQVLLHQLKQEVQGKKIPLFYRHENYYETFSLQEGEVTEEKVNQQITSAVLLDMIEHLYLSQFERKQYQEHTWISIVHALYQSAENTFYRLRTGFLSQIKKENEQHLWTLWQQQFNRQEIQLIQQLLIDGWEAKERLYTVQEQYRQYNEQLWEQVREHAEILYAIEEPLAESEETLLTGEKKEGIAEKQKQEKPSEKEKTVSIQKEKDKSSKEEQIFKQEQGKISLEILEKAIKELPSEDASPKSKEKNALEESSIQMTLRSFMEENNIHYDDLTEQYVQWVEEGQKKFYQSMEQYLSASWMPIEEMIDIVREQMPYEEAKGQKNFLTQIIYPDKAHDEQLAKTAETVFLKWQEQEATPIFTEEKSLKTYQDSQNDNREYLAPKLEAQIPQTLQEVLIEQQKVLNNQTDIRFTQEHTNQSTLQEEHFETTALLPPDEEDIIRQQLQKINQQNIANYAAYQKIQKEQEREQKKAVSAKRDMRKDGLKALQNPELLLQEIEQARAEDEQRRKKERAQFAQLLPEHTKQVYQRLEQYLNTPEKRKESDRISKNNTALLLYDIQKIETEKLLREQLEAEEIHQIQKTSKEVFEKWKESSMPEASTYYPKSHNTSTQPPVSLVHKSVDNQLNEEQLYELLRQNQTIHKTIHTDEQEEYHQEIAKKTIYQQNQQVLEKENTDLTELIQRGVQRQMGAISEQIYNKLEKRLQNEKKRRGY